MKLSKKAENEQLPEVTENEVKNEPAELEDDLLDGVAGGLVQLVNPSSSRL